MLEPTVQSRDNDLILRGTKGAHATLRRPCHTETPQPRRCDLGQSISLLFFTLRPDRGEPQERNSRSPDFFFEGGGGGTLLKSLSTPRYFVDELKIRIWGACDSVDAQLWRSVRTETDFHSDVFSAISGPIFRTFLSDSKYFECWFPYPKTFVDISSFSFLK
jgi:hypothetical protein